MKKMRLTGILALVFVMIFSSIVSAAPKEKGITRGEFVKELVETFEIEVDSSAAIPFGDVANRIDAPYIATAAKKGIIAGHGDKFNPDGELTQEQAIIMTIKALGVMDINHAIEPDKVNQLITTIDRKNISPWAQSYIAYAIENGLVSREIHPQTIVNKEEAKQLLEKAKEDSLREGLTAAKMLELASEKILEYGTYKFKSNVVMDVALEGLPEGEEQVRSEISQEGIFQAPENTYVISRSIAKAAGEDIEQVSEVLLKDRVMYVKVGEGEEWIEMDMNPILGELEMLSGSNNGLSQLTQQNLDIFGLYAYYAKDTEMNGKPYYVIKINIDTKVFKEIYKKVIDETVDHMFNSELWNQMKKDQNVPEEITEKEFKAMLMDQIGQMVNNMEVTTSQTYFINKETKTYDHSTLNQEVNMKGLNTSTKMEAVIDYYDFGVPVSFPQIKK